MMKYRLVVIALIFWFGFSSCKRNLNSNQEEKTEVKNILEKGRKPEPIRDLTGTKWFFEIAENCTNLYTFKRNEFSFYSCEIEDISYGNYYIENDTLYLHELISASDSLLSKDSPHRSGESKYKIVIEGGKLKHIARYARYNGIWRKSDFVFDEDYLYRKMKE